jgi:hypothetical protein
MKFTFDFSNMLIDVEVFQPEKNSIGMECEVVSAPGLLVVVQRARKNKISIPKGKVFSSDEIVDSFNKTNQGVI